jgi:hypothetical protein
VGLTEPYVRLSTTLNGPERTAEIRQLEARLTPPRFTAHAQLILDMLNSNPMLFIRGDEAEEAWRVVKRHQDPPADPSADRYSRNEPDARPGPGPTRPPRRLGHRRAHTDCQLNPPGASDPAGEGFRRPWIPRTQIIC